jgi:hypothetical protein
MTSTKSDDELLQIFFEYLSYVTTECDIFMTDAEFDTLKKLVARQSYEFIMQFKKVELIESLINSVNYQLSQILKNQNHLIVHNSQVVGQVVGQGPVVNQDQGQGQGQGQVVNQGQDQGQGQVVNQGQDQGQGQGQGQVMGQVIGQPAKRYFDMHSYCMLRDLYKNLCVTWQCPCRLEDIANELKTIKKTLEQEKTALAVIANMLQINMTKYYMVKSYRTHVGVFLIGL